MPGWDPIWAISSMVASIDPNVNLAYQTFRGRFINAILGCTIGLLFLTMGGVERLEASGGACP